MSNFLRVMKGDAYVSYRKIIFLRNVVTISCDTVLPVDAL